MAASCPLVIVTSGQQPLLGRAVQRQRAPLWLVSPDPGAVRAAGRGDARWIRIPDGRGFAAAAAVALERASAEGHQSVVLLNDDAVLLPGARGALEREVGRPGVAAAGAVVWEEGGSRVQSAGLAVRFGGGRVRARRRAPPPGTGSAHVVRALPATALALRVGPVCAVGGFDGDRFPFYFEDVDLCLRLGAAGYRVVLVPGARAIHRGAATAGRMSAFSAYHATRGHLALCRVHPAGGAVACALAAVLSVGAQLRPGSDPVRARASALLHGLHDGLLTPPRD